MQHQRNRGSKVKERRPSRRSINRRKSGLETQGLKNKRHLSKILGVSIWHLGRSEMKGASTMQRRNVNADGIAGPARVTNIVEWKASQG